VLLARLPLAVTWIVAVVLFVGIVWVGMSMLRGFTRTGGRQRIEPEDVQDLDVYFVCGECGTEFQVTRLGEVQVPRHCGEPMHVVRRPRSDPALS